MPSFSGTSINHPVLRVRHDHSCNGTQGQLVHAHGFKGDIFPREFTIAFTAMWFNVDDWSNVLSFGTWPWWQNQNDWTPLNAIRVFGRGWARILTSEFIQDGWLSCP